MKRSLFLLMVGAFTGLYAQTPADTSLTDLRYLEDQFYVGLTYNLALNKPEGVTQRNLSYGLMGGFIKDIPLNPDRDIALGIGLGYAVNSYYTNLVVSETEGGFRYQILEGSDILKRSKIETHLIEVPLEFRWRTSTPSSYRFWRLYTGLKFAYVMGSRSKLVTNAYSDSFYNTDTRNFRYGLMLNFGFNTFNIHAYYALNPLFEKGTQTEDGQAVDFTPLRIGLIFYIL